MSESRSEWAPPVDKPKKSADELLRERYADRENPDDLDDMVMISSEQQSTDMITVPDWSKTAPEAGDAGYETGFDDNPFAKGKEIIVRRNANKETGAPAYNDGGWKIIDDDANVRIGKDKYMVGVVVEKEIDGIMREKSIPLDELMRDNPRETETPPEVAEKVPLTEVQEEIADEAIEDAIGVRDPSEIDENARYISTDDLRAMREAAQRSAGLDAPVTAEAAAEAAKPTPDEVLSKLTEGLSADDLLELRSYAEATDEVRDAQKEGRGEDSTYWQQIKGQSLRAMSPKAQSVANRYTGYYNMTK